MTNTSNIIQYSMKNKMNISYLHNLIKLPVGRLKTLETVDLTLRLSLGCSLMVISNFKSHINKYNQWLAGHKKGRVLLPQPHLHQSAKVITGCGLKQRLHRASENVAPARLSTAQLTPQQREPVLLSLGVILKICWNHAPWISSLPGWSWTQEIGRLRAEE